MFENKEIADSQFDFDQFFNKSNLNPHLYEILQALTDGVIVQDRMRKVLFANEAGAHMMGFRTANEILERPVSNSVGKFEIMDENGNALDLDHLPAQVVLDGAEICTKIMFSKNRETGVGIWSEVKARAIRDEDGSVKFAVSLFRDITSEKLIQAEYERSNRRSQHILESITDGFFAFDKNWNFTYINKAAEQFLDRLREQLLGKNLLEEFKNVGQNEAFIRLKTAAEKGETIRFEQQSRQGLWFELSLYPSRDGSSVYFREITDKKKSEEYNLKLLASEERYRAMIENSSDGIVMLNADGTITYVTHPIERILGFSEQEIVGMVAFDLIHPEDLPLVMEIFGNMLRAPNATSSAQFRARHKDGTYRWIEGVGTNLLQHPSIQSIVANFRDVSQRKKAEDTLAYHYQHDVLTDLPNRTYLTSRFAESLQESDRARKSVALMLIDLDRFKQINESLGHALGDRLIQEVSLRLRACMSESCVLARLGGDEFGILICNLEREEDEVAKLCNKILEDFKPAFYLDAHELYISPSIGISLYPYDGREPAMLFKNAETALYRAKDYGRNTYQFYTQTMNATAYERLAMESKLRHAIENNELVLFYQPQIEVVSGKIVGAEELIRWQQPDGRLVAPDRFIPLAEANGLIEPIGEFVLQQSLIQAKIWHDAGFKLIIAINLSARQFKQKNFEKILTNIIEESQLDPKFIELELTETVLAENQDTVFGIMNGLRGRGVRFCLDDFSTGYSSLKYLKQFPVDMLKIERNFMKGIPGDIQNAAIAKSIITLGQSLGMEVTAEGVESKRQLEFLRDNLCNRAQGYLFNGAMPAHSLSEILGEHRYLSVVKNLDNQPKAGRP
ncbi:MAG TPA: EAL domain-containing protein [Patescibacteria group bacterium]|nr:EAL domain-containing protein [Patescibacteria group bacterium]